MTEERLIDFSFEGYLKNGGKLSRESFDIAMNVWPRISKGEEIEVSERSMSQAEGLGERCNIPVTREQKCFYARLRQMDIKGLEKGLCDEEVFAETLLWAGDNMNREIFVNKYPHVFKK